MKTFMTMLLASFGVMTLMLAGCDTTQEDVVDEEEDVMEEEEDVVDSMEEMEEDAMEDAQ